jgi:hypothetical protein
MLFPGERLTLVMRTPSATQCEWTAGRTQAHRPAIRITPMPRQKILFNMASLRFISRPASPSSVFTSTPTTSPLILPRFSSHQRNGHRTSPHQHRLVQSRRRKGSARSRRPDSPNRTRSVLAIRFRRCRLLLRHPRRPHTRRCVRLPASRRCSCRQWLAASLLAMRDSCSR